MLLLGICPGGTTLVISLLYNGRYRRNEGTVNLRGVEPFLACEVLQGNKSLYT
jgi:hypothetical protein